jgi:hypothetical protein
MNEYADLEISLHRHDRGAYLDSSPSTAAEDGVVRPTYAVEFRYNHPESDTDVRLGQGKLALAQFDFAKLRAQAFDAANYGQTLTACLFSDEGVKTAFAEARATAEGSDLPLRVRLLIGPTAPELHGLRWETLRDPRDGSPIWTGESLLFSRYLSSLDWRPVRLKPKGDLRALVVVANPANLADYGLAAIDVEGEIERARQALGSIGVTRLPAGPGAPRATLNNLLSCLKEGGGRSSSGAEAHDILYLVCHGALIKDEPWLWLEDDEGKVARTAGSELVLQIKKQVQQPRLVVLGSCESAAAGIGEALAGLGPRLAEAGVPAVLAMQGKIALETLAQFMPVFFEELQVDGQIDRAMAVARGAARGRVDAWMPALYMRLKSGRIWYVPGFGDDRKFEKWPALTRSIKRGQCTPILGPGLVEPLLGSLSEIAQRWAETYHYPMAPHERESLPQVAQYLAINQDRGFPVDELVEYLKREIRLRYTSELPEGLRQGAGRRDPTTGELVPEDMAPPAAQIDELIEKVGAGRRKRDPREPHKVLASLPLPIFITTNLDNLLVAALKEAGKDPQLVLCPWNDYVEQAETIYDREPEYHPSPDRPLVYHLFGRFSEPDSVVLTEDDYFKFLIGVTSNKDLIPPVVRRALSDTALLFLGFQMDDWNFRVLFHSILSQQGGRRDRYAHIAAQIVPEEGRILEPERARSYLENYFSRGADISIYWGSADDFVEELLKRWTESRSA